MKVYAIAALMSLIFLSCAAPYEPEKDEKISYTSENNSYTEFTWSSGATGYYSGSGYGTGNTGTGYSAEISVGEDPIDGLSSSEYETAPLYGTPDAPGVSSLSSINMDSILQSLGIFSSADIALPFSSITISQSVNGSSPNLPISSSSNSGASGTSAVSGQSHSTPASSIGEGLSVSSQSDTYMDLLNTFKGDNPYLTVMEQAFTQGNEELAGTVYEYMMQKPEYKEQMQQLQANVLQDTELITSVANAYIQNPEEIDVSAILIDQGVDDPLDQFLITQYLNVLFQN
ncbi:MAG: hypothetical protein OCD01_15505 [Fibrobacterales bacterium]